MKIKLIPRKCFLFFLISMLTVFAQSVFAASFTGTLNILVSDKFKEKHAKTIYTLETTNTSYTLSLPKKQLHSSLKTGDIVTVIGDYQETAKHSPLIKVQQIKLIKPFKPSAQDLTGDHHTLVLLLDFNDKKASDTTSVAEVTGHMYTDEKSMRQNFLESSFSQVNFVPDSNGDGTPDVYTIHLNYNAENACAYNKWATDGKAEAIAQGIDTSLYRHFMFVLPNNVSCAWGGLGNLGCGNSCKTWIKWNAKIVYAHELGHNLGMHHAATDPNNDGKVNSEYGDHSGIMGNGGYRQVNAPHRMQMGWYDTHPNNVKTMSKSGKVKLFSLDKPPRSSRKQVVKLTKEGINYAYYLSYRTDVGTFGMGNNYLKKINVHRFPGPGNRTLFLKALANNDEFIAPFEGIKVKALRTKDNFGRVKVTYESKCSFNTMPCQMSQNNSVEALDGVKNYLSVTVPEGTTLLSIDTAETVDSPDVKLYVRYAEIPTRKLYDCRSQTPGGTQICSMENPAPGTWYIFVTSVEPHEGITVMNQVDTGNVKKH